MTETTLTSGPERYVRINISQNSKGFTYETTVSLRWPEEQTTTGAWWDALDNMLDASRLLAEQEIAKREAGDAA